MSSAMKILSTRTIFIFSTRSLSINPIKIAQFRHLHSSSSSHSFASRRHEEESRNVRVSVWWDFENCHLPVGANVFKVAHCITSAVRAIGIKGPVQITAFGDIMQLSRSNQEALSATGITLTHIPNGGKNSADRSLLVDLMYWVSQNPPPAHLFLISGDRDFSSILHRLRMNNYNILLASPETAPGVLCSAASIMWHWNSLVKGENLTGKHFNQPPDGPYGSWYGHYKVPLEDSFAVIEQPTSSRTEEVSESNQEPKLRSVPKAVMKQISTSSYTEEVSESNQDPKLQAVPKAVMKQIRNILNSYSKGISITDLRSELVRSNLSLDKELYGYKKFSRFLLSMPQILKLQSGPDGQLFVHSVCQKIPQPIEPTLGVTTGPVATNEEPCSVPTQVEGVDGLGTKVVDEKPSIQTTTELKGKSSPLVEKVDKAEANEQPSHLVEMCNSTSEAGFSGSIWRKWLFGFDGVSGTKGSSCQSNSENAKTDEVHARSTSQIEDAVNQISCSSSNDEKLVDEKVAGVHGAYDEKSRRDVGFFKKMLNWCMFWRENASFETSSEQSNEKLDQVTVESGKHELFLQESFWKEMEIYINTPPNGSVLVLHSKSRKEMAHSLQKHGPLALRSLSENELLHLVDLLISQKRWVEECPSQMYPFKLVRPARKSSSLSSPPNISGLRSAFVSTSSQPSSGTLPDHCEERRNHNLPHAGVSPSIINKKLSGSGKSRNKILSDCQKLVDDIVRECPEGFNMGLFRKLFRERFGYNLDVQKLGYQKLVTLLQIMPGVKVESSHIYPSCNAASSLQNASPIFEGKNHIRAASKSDGELSDSSNKVHDDLDSPWEELGPLASTGSKRNEEFKLLNGVNEDTVKQLSCDYEALADNCISDSEEETSPLIGAEEQGKPRTNGEDSSLLQILDSWYSTKEEKSVKEGSDNVDGMVDCSVNVSKPSGLYGSGMKMEAHTISCGRKQRPSKSYSFVTEQIEDNKDKLIDGILGSLKKSGDSRIHG